MLFMASYHLVASGYGHLAHKHRRTNIPRSLVCSSIGSLPTWGEPQVKWFMVNSFHLMEGHLSLLSLLLVAHLPSSHLIVVNHHLGQKL